MARKHYKCYAKEYQLMSKGLLTMEGGLYSLLSNDADFYNIVHLTKAKKADFMRSLGSKSKTPEKVCGNMINKLIKSDLIVRVDRGTYMLNPHYRDKQNNSNSFAELMKMYLKYKHEK